MYDSRLGSALRWKEAIKSSIGLTDRIGKQTIWKIISIVSEVDNFRYAE